MHPRSPDYYQPRAEWFTHDAHGIHGLSHVARVWVWAEVMAGWLRRGGEPVDVEVVRWAAALHDVGRLDDGKDREHGERSAHWVTDHSHLLPASLDPRQIQSIQYCCRWHVPHDSQVPLMTYELLCLKEADALDRVRIHDLDVCKLRTGFARSLAGPAQQLYDATRDHRAPDPWGAVCQAASAHDPLLLK
jgi:hypothetical protein